MVACKTFIHIQEGNNTLLSTVIKAGQSRLVVVLNDQETDYSREAVGTRRSFANKFTFPSKKCRLSTKRVVHITILGRKNVRNVLQASIGFIVLACLAMTTLSHKICILDMLYGWF